MSTGKIVVGALAGLAMGSLLGILFAPEKGSRTRRKILSKGEDYMDDFKEKVQDYVENLKDTYEKTLQDTAHLLSKEAITQEENHVK
ncbi:MAG: YtxH domain-containing protein [Chitinophagaceae bacterium]|nr:YtxH domain-containing protein [Chitinophagaceae bacterium]